MLSKIKFAAGLAALTILAALIVVFSLKPKAQPEPQSSTLDEHFTPQIELANSVADEPEDGRFAPEDHPLPEQRPYDELADHPQFPVGNGLTLEELALLDSLEFGNVRDVALDDDRALMATAGGVLEFFLSDSSFTLYSYPQDLVNHDCYAVLPYEDNILVGTEAGIYLINPIGVVERVWEEITDTVTVLKSFDGCFYVGTRHDGLYEINGQLVGNILPAKQIVDVSSDQFALWAATAEDGLLYFDEHGWHERYLITNRDAFANVTALESAFGKLFVGTTTGVFIYDGHNWQHLDSSDYLFQDHVTALAAGRSYMYIGTATEGVFAYYEGWLTPLDWSDDVQVTSLDVKGGRYLVGRTQRGAILADRKGELELLPLIKQTVAVLSSL